MKEKYDHRLLLKHLPSDLKQFLEHIQTLNYADKPDYVVSFSAFLLRNISFSTKIPYLSFRPLIFSLVFGILRIRIRLSDAFV